MSKEVITLYSIDGKTNYDINWQIRKKKVAGVKQPPTLRSITETFCQNWQENLGQNKHKRQHGWAIRTTDLKTFCLPLCMVMTFLWGSFPSDLCCTGGSTQTIAQLVERQACRSGGWGSNPGRVRPKILELVVVASLLTLRTRGQH